MRFVIEEDSINEENLKKELVLLDTYADSFSNILKTKKISAQISDTLYAYKYIAANKNLQKESEWEQYLPYLIPDFAENHLARFDTIIGKEYIDLIKKQIHY
ncbi:hypothetical protein P3875_00895 [Myroides sp. JBRI-B21084]|uniref:hypothetical protein n=1 Tax=Myroides sp. JBRI-B21084 TaxID=3119977 RepID=UPI0026E21F75|nr:hypothetical protein [Paenimyroides cloacae]WKW46666.1 hypothetical protein P3875_00895 [Paenimyroides cloacae]